MLSGFTRFLVVGWLALASACAPTQPPPTGAPPGASTGSPDQAIWNELTEAARKEGKLVLAGNPSPENRDAIPNAFKERFGVEIEYLVGRGSDLQNRIGSERAAGIYSVDLVFSGSPVTYGMLREGWFDPLLPHLVVPEVTDPSVWRNNQLPFLDPEKRFIFKVFDQVTGEWFFNTQQVSDAELRSLDDLVNAKWRGKIVLEDPTVSGSGQGDGVYLYLVKGEEFFKRVYVDQQPVFSRDRRQMSDWIARGTYLITSGLSVEDLPSIIEQGLPVKGLGPLAADRYRTSSGGSTLAILKNAPNRNAAKLFVNWLASREGMQLVGKIEARVPVRKDIEAPWAQPWQIPKEGLDYIDTDHYVYQNETVPPIVARIREILGR